MRYLAFTFFILFTGCNSIPSEKEELESVVVDSLLKALLENEIEESHIEGKYIQFQDSSFVLPARTKELINNQLNQISKGDTDKKRLLEQLVSKNGGVVFSILEDGHFKSQSINNDKTDLVGFVRVCKPFISKNGTAAVYFFEYICGSDCGSGNLVFAKKENATWSVDSVEKLYTF